MIALGVYGGADGRAASIAQDGTILSAVRVEGGTTAVLLDDAMLDAITSSLDVAGTAAADVDRVFVVDPSASATAETSFTFEDRRHPLSEALGDTPATRVPLAVAHASLMRATASGDSAGLILTTHGDTSGGAYVHIGDRALRTFDTIPWVDDFAWALQRTAAALGGHTQAPVTYLEALAAGDSAAHSECCDILSFKDFAIACDRGALERCIDAVQQRTPGPLDRRSAHLDVQRARRRLAAGVLNVVADHCGEVGRRWCQHVGADRLLLAGDIFESSEFLARMARSAGSAAAVPLPQNSASALGAALHPFTSIAHLDSLALGPAFDEQAVKTVLENCRLEYIYEPQWDRLLALVSGVLSTGALVGWFQGRGDFGRRSLGSRSVLADPSVAYVRDNVNVFLLEREVDTALPVTLLPSFASSLLGDFASERVVTAPAAYRKLLAGAIDPRGNMRVMPSAPNDSLLPSLLEAHCRRTGVPGLVNVPMSVPSAHLASSPREAVRSVFGSAVDMLVIGRFLVSKDRWLLRGT